MLPGSLTLEGKGGRLCDKPLDDGPKLVLVPYNNNNNNRV